MMMKMLCALFLCLTLFSGGRTELVLQSAGKGWAAARQSCKARGPTCDLATLRLQQQQQQQQQAWLSLPLPIGSSSWVGARVLERLVWQLSKRPLIADQGCYEMSEDLRADMRSLRRYNGPEKCLALCTTNIIALQDTSCYCVSPDEMALLQQRPLEDCYRNCNREPFRCGGDNSRISVYKIPDGTLYQYEKGKRANKFFWRRGNNNEQEFLIFTNKPGKQKQQLCAAGDGSGGYSSRGLKESCPAGSATLSFEDVDVREFMANTSSRREWDPVSFALPLGYSKQALWLDGGAVRTEGGRGPCVAINYDGQRHSLVKVACKTALPSVCSCYTPRPPTTTTETSTELTTTTTTTTTSTSTTTQVPEKTTTTATTTSTSTTATETPTTTTTPAAAEAEAETDSSTAETTAAMMTSAAAEEATATGKMAETFAPWKTMTNEQGSSSSSSSSASSSSSSDWTDMAASSTSGPELNSSVFVAEDKAKLQPDERSGSHSELLFPFSDMKGSDGPSRIAPPSVNHEESTEDQAPASATASIELIVGVSVAVVALMLIVIIVIIGVKRRKQKSSSSLLKAKKQAERAPESGTSYPI